MGWAEVENTETVTLRNFSAGTWFNYPNDQIPGTINGSEPIGFMRTSNLVWLNNRLSKMFGYNQIQSSNLNNAITSVFYASAFSSTTLLGTAGAAIYRGLQLAAPTDITGGLTVTATATVKWVNWKFGSTSYAIGVSTVNPPWKVANAGNATALGGSHGITSSGGIAAWQNSLWLVAGTTPTLRFSSLGDPEVWAANDNYVFDEDIRDIKPFGNMLVVFKRTSIGVLYGTNNRQLTKVDKFVVGIGHDSICEAVPGKLGNKDVLFFINKNGVYVFDGTNSVTKISGSLDFVFNPPYVASIILSQPQILLGTNANFQMAFVPDWSWLLLFYIDSTGAGTNYFILDLNYTKQTGPNSLATAVWWIEGTAGRFAGATYSPQRFSLTYPEIYLWGPNHRVCLLDPSLDTRKEDVSGAAVNYTCSGKTKLFDLGGEYLLQEVNLEQAFYTPDGTAVRTGVDFNRGNDDDTTVLGLVTFALAGTEKPFFWNNSDSNLAGDNPINFGRWLNFYLFGATTSKLFAVEGISAVISSFGPDPNVGNTSN